MQNELLTALKSHLDKHPDQIKDFTVIDRLMSSVRIAHKDSHGYRLYNFNG